MLPDPRMLSYDQRMDTAERVRALYDIQPWPELEWFNSAPCETHAPALNIMCRHCGIRLRRHQRIGAAWLYLGIPSLLSDTVGSGKTAQILAMLAMCKQTGELSTANRAVIVCKAAAVWDPWGNETRRLLPGIKTYIADGDKDQRMRGYMGDWEIAVVSDRTFAGAHGKKQSREGDVALLEAFPVGMLFYDDIDPMRNPNTEAAQAIGRLAKRCRRVNGAHATPLQKRLRELHSFLVPLGGEMRLGSEQRVVQRYGSSERRIIRTRDPRDKTGRAVIRRQVSLGGEGITLSPRRREEFRNAIRPLVLRRTADDMDDVELPAVQYNPVFLDLNPRQRSRYEELRRGVLRRLKQDGMEITTAEAAAAFTRGSQICSGLATLDDCDGADDSAKLDWFMDAITGDLCDEKAVVFINYKPNVAALSARLKSEGIRHVLMWSEDTDKRRRAAALAQFREDPLTRVLVGTTTIEASLNLQIARNIVPIDTILNPARMAQLIGRVRRVGSPYPTVYVHHLLARGTQEDAYLPMLRREHEISDVVWDENSNIWNVYNPRQMMGMVATGRLIAA